MSLEVTYPKPGLVSLKERIGKAVRIDDSPLLPVPHVDIPYAALEEREDQRAQEPVRGQDESQTIDHFGEDRESERV